MNRHPRISDHGLIGDLQSSAFVATDGALDWSCCPRFDSPTVFASPDAEGGGYYRIAPRGGLRGPILTAASAEPATATPGKGAGSE